MSTGGGAPAVDRLLGLVIATCGILATVAAWHRIAMQIPDFAVWWSAVALVPVLLLVTLVLVGGSLPIGRLRGAWVVLVVLVIAVQATTFMAYTGPDPDALRPWVWVIELPAMCLLPLLYRPVIAFLVAVLMPLSMVVSGWAAHGYVPDTVLAMTPIHVGNFAMLLVVIAVRRRLITLGNARRRSRRLDVRRIRAQALLRRQREVARLVHDDVLSALTAAIRLPGPSRAEVRDAARLGLEALRNAVHAPSPAPRTSTELDSAEVHRMLVDTIGRRAAANDLRITVHPGTIPEEVATQSSLAIAEALRNSAAHAPHDRAMITGRIGSDALHVVVADRGPGFDPGATNPERMGIGLSILGRMRDLPGGAADVISGPRGTSVEVGWIRSISAALDTGLSSRTAKTALIFVWFTGVLHGAIAGYSPLPNPPIGVLTYAILLLGAILATSGPAGPLPGKTAVAVIGCCFFVVLSVTWYADAAGTPAGELWLVTFTAYVGGVVIGRGNLVIGGIGFGASIAWLGVWAWDTHQPLVGYVAMVTPVLLSALAGCTWLFGVSAITRREQGILAAVRRAVAETAAAGSGQRASRRELREILREVGPLLEQIADGATIDHGLVRDLEAVEGGVRDRIRAAGLHRPVLAKAVAAARRRGVRVLLLGDDASPGRISHELAEVIAGLVAADGARSITIRAFAERVTVLVEDTDGGRERVVLGPDGAPAQNGQIRGT